ncbi:MAG: exodeoxyribonuclease III [Sulfuricaulis sp.]
MRVITLNVNGIRSAVSKGLFSWLARQRADIVCLQEIKAQERDLPNEMRAPGGFHGFFSCAEKKGYAGVALYCRRAPDKIHTGFGSFEHDSEGRYLQADFGQLSVVSIYLPSGSAGPHRQESKYRFLDHFSPILKHLRHTGREYILCGDWNIAHKEIDLKNWRSNRKNSGFLPAERAWLSQVFGELGWVDVFRTLNDQPDQYTWWSNRGQAWAKNVGWRIDYQIATPGIASKAKRERLYKDQRFSDHAPLIIDYDCQL